MKRGNPILECSTCLRGFHLRCLKPALKKVPDGDWFCPDCNAGEQQRGRWGKRGGSAQLAQTTKLRHLTVLAVSSALCCLQRISLQIHAGSAIAHLYTKPQVVALHWPYDTAWPVFTGSAYVGCSVVTAEHHQACLHSHLQGVRHACHIAVLR